MRVWNGLTKVLCIKLNIISNSSYLDIMESINNQNTFMPCVFPTRLLPLPEKANLFNCIKIETKTEALKLVKTEDEETWNLAHCLFKDPSRIQLPRLTFDTPSVNINPVNINVSSTSSREEKKSIVNFQIKKETKQVKGVENQIFAVRFTELYSFLETIEDEDLNFIVGKKKANYFKHDRKTKRRSGYRGVSRNGASWQVLMMINKVKTYIGWYESEEEGALVYDIVSILFKQKKARTNLSYSKTKLLHLLSFYDHDSKHFHTKIPEKYLAELQICSIEEACI